MCRAQEPIQMSYRVLFQFDLFMQPAFRCEHGTAYRHSHTRTHTYIAWQKHEGNHKNDKIHKQSPRVKRQQEKRIIIYTIMIQYKMEKDKSRRFVLFYFNSILLCSCERRQCPFVNFILSPPTPITIAIPMCGHFQPVTCACKPNWIFFRRLGWNKQKLHVFQFVPSESLESHFVVFLDGLWLSPYIFGVCDIIKLEYRTAIPLIVITLCICIMIACRMMMNISID